MSLLQLPSKARSLTDHQEQIIEAIIVWGYTHNWSPSHRELADLLKIKATFPISKRLQRLRKKGLVAWKDGKPRTLRLTL